MKYVGIDLSYTAAGLAIYGDGGSGFDVFKTFTFRTKAIKGDHSVSAFLGRSRYVCDSIFETARLEPDDRVIIESPSYASKSGDLDRIHGNYWRMMDLLDLAVETIATASPQQRAKYATGKGTSPKSVVEAAARKMYPMAPIQNDNEADAVILVAMLLRHDHIPIDRGLTQDQLDAMTLVKWEA